MSQDFKPPDWSDPNGALEYIRSSAERKILEEWTWYEKLGNVPWAAPRVALP